MRSIVVLAINARWTHTAFGARCLLANLGALRRRAELIERTINDRAVEIVEEVFARDPEILALGVYVWNATLCAEVVALVKALRPDLPVVLGGPEVICRDDLPAFASLADHVIAGEAESAFREVCERVLEGKAPEFFISAEPAALDGLQSAYDLYSEDDLAHRKLYIEASRGCVYGCKFCLSSLDRIVRRFPKDTLLEDLETLWERGARHFKFVDRALHTSVGPEVLEFLLDTKQYLATNHEPCQVGRGCFGRQQSGGSHLPLSQYCDPVGNLHYLSQLVGDEDQGFALVYHGAQDVEEVFDFLGGEGRRGLIHDQDIGSPVEHL